MINKKNLQEPFKLKTYDLTCVYDVLETLIAEYAQSKVNWNQKESDDDTVEWKKNWIILPFAISRSSC